MKIAYVRRSSAWWSEIISAMLSIDANKSRKPASLARDLAALHNVNEANARCRIYFFRKYGTVQVAQKKKKSGPPFNWSEFKLDELLKFVEEIQAEIKNQQEAIKKIGEIEMLLERMGFSMDDYLRLKQAAGHRKVFGEEV